MSAHFLPQIQLIFHVCPAFCFFFVLEDEITCYSWTDISLTVIKTWPFLPATYSFTVPLLPLCKLLALTLVTSFSRPLLVFCCSAVLGFWQAGFFRTYGAELLPLHPEYNVQNILLWWWWWWWSWLFSPQSTKFFWAQLKVVVCHRFHYTFIKWNRRVSVFTMDEKCTLEAVLPCICSSSSWCWERTLLLLQIFEGNPEEHTARQRRKEGCSSSIKALVQPVMLWNHTLRHTLLQFKKQHR